MRGVRRLLGWRAMVLGGLLGVAMGIGLFTFHYAHGASYLSSDPKMCVHCHIMQSEYDAWQKSSHHAVATCVDCHLPASGLAKWIAKGVNGFNHSRAFTFQDFPEPIVITPRNAEILQDNCVRCHRDFVHGILGGDDTSREPVSCVHCHLGVGHGERVGLGGPDRGVEEEGGRR